MNKKERDEYYLNILTKLCHEVDYNTTKEIIQVPDIAKIFQDYIKEDDCSDFNVAISYLESKGYLISEMRFVQRGLNFPWRLKITSSGIDLIDRLENQQDCISYSKDFLVESLNSISNINNSNIIINSPNASIKVSFQQTINNIQQIPDSILSKESKEELSEKIQEVENVKSDKKTCWEKIKPILIWLVDKSADAAIAVLPYLLEKIK